MSAVVVALVFLALCYGAVGLLGFAVVALSSYRQRQRHAQTIRRLARRMRIERATSDAIAARMAAYEMANGQCFEDPNPSQRRPNVMN